MNPNAHHIWPPTTPKPSPPSTLKLCPLTRNGSQNNFFKYTVKRKSLFLVSIVNIIIKYLHTIQLEGVTDWHKLWCAVNLPPPLIKLILAWKLLSSNFGQILVVGYIDFDCGFCKILTERMLFSSVGVRGGASPQTIVWFSRSYSCSVRLFILYSTVVFN